MCSDWSVPSGVFGTWPKKEPLQFGTVPEKRGESIIVYTGKWMSTLSFRYFIKSHQIVPWIILCHLCTVCMSRFSQNEVGILPRKVSPDDYLLELSKLTKVKISKNKIRITNFQGISGLKRQSKAHIDFPSYDIQVSTWGRDIRSQKMILNLRTWDLTYTRTKTQSFQDAFKDKKELALNTTRGALVTGP